MILGSCQAEKAILLTLGLRSSVAGLLQDLRLPLLHLLNCRRGLSTGSSRLASAAFAHRDIVIAFWCFGFGAEEALPRSEFCLI